MIFESKIFFEGGYLKSLTVSDIHPGYINGLNDPEVHRYLEAPKRNYQTFETVENFVKANILDQSSFLFGVWLDGDDLNVGTVRLHGIDHYHHCALIGICIFDKKVWGQGLGCKVISSCTRWATTHLNLRWIEAGAYKSNIASVKAFEKCGYQPVWDIEGKYYLEGSLETVKVLAFKV